MKKIFVIFALVLSLVAVSLPALSASSMQAGPPEPNVTTLSKV